MRYYTFHIGDYTSHTRGLSLIEDLAYRRLIDECYLHERPLTGTPESIADDIGMADHGREVARVLSKFFRQTDDGWVHDRIVADIEDMTSRATLARENGRRGGRPRKSETGSVSTETQPFTTHNPLPITQNPPTPTDPVVVGTTVRVSRRADAEVAERFPRFWAAYPRKVSKGDALKAWMKIAPDEAMTEQMIAAVRRHAQSRDWQKDNGQFIPHPATWLNGRRWEDEVDVGAAGGSGDPFEGML